MFMFFKFVALLVVTIIGIVVAITGFSHDGKPNQDWKSIGWFDGTSTSASSWAVALYAGLWAFDGWDNVSILVFSLLHLLTFFRPITLLESFEIQLVIFQGSSTQQCPS